MNYYSPSNRPMQLIVRILRRVRREVSLIFHLIYVLGMVAPTLILKGLVSFPLSVGRGHEAILIFCKNCFVKIAISKKSTIEQEYLNWVAILQKHPMLAECFPRYTFIRNTFFSCLLSERLFPIPLKDALISAVRVRIAFDNCASQNTRLAFDKYSQIHAGLNCVQIAFGSEVAISLREIVKDYLINYQYHVGLSHGDFHSRNIMRDLNNFDRMIDLDCIRFEGIVEIDVVHFTLEMKWSHSGILWTDTLALAFDLKGKNIIDSLRAFSVPWNNTLGVIYFLDRIGQEFVSYGCRYQRDQLMCVINSMRNAGLFNKQDIGTGIQGQDQTGMTIVKSDCK